MTKTLTLTKLKGYQSTRWAVRNTQVMVETPNNAKAADVTSYLAGRIMDNPQLQAMLGVLGCDDIRFKVVKS